MSKKNNKGLKGLFLALTLRWEAMKLKNKPFTEKDVTKAEKDPKRVDGSDLLKPPSQGLIK